MLRIKIYIFQKKPAAIDLRSKTMMNKKIGNSTMQFAIAEKFHEKYLEEVSMFLAASSFISLLVVLTITEPVEEPLNV